MTDSSTKIQPLYKTVKDFFKNFYCVPKYQREYIWGSEAELIEKDGKALDFIETDDPVFMLISDIHAAYAVQDTKTQKSIFWAP